MEFIHKKFFWPTKLIHEIPLSDFLNASQDTEKIYKSIQKSKIYLDKKIIDFILTLCMIGRLSVETSQAAIVSLYNCLIKDKSLIKLDIQLLAMANVLLCSKIFDRRPIPLGLLHKLTSHYYNNNHILTYETKVLKVLDYNLFLRDDLISERMGLYLESIRNCFLEEEFSFFLELCNKLLLLIFEERKFIKELSIDHLSVSIIQAAFILITKTEGKFPFTYKLAALSEIKIETIIKISYKILMHCLGKETFKQYNF